MIHDLYDLGHDHLSHELDPEDSVTFYADMYLVAKRYGLYKLAESYLDAVLIEVFDDMGSSQYVLHVAKFCGPSAAACYADSELSEKIFDGILLETRLLLDENEAFCKSLENGTLFNSKYSGRFAMKVVEMYRDAEKDSW